MEQLMNKILSEIGVTVNGDKPYDIKIHNPQVYTKILTQHSVGAGEAYMEGMWDCDQLDELFFRICRKKTYDKVYPKLDKILKNIKNTIINQQTRNKSEEVAHRHYNLGNKLFEAMLGKTMAYTCGYWKDANSLDQAQLDKYDLVCKKLNLKPGERVLELGCGWGGLAKHIAEKYGCEVVAFDIGVQPATYAANHCAGLPVTIFNCDYRDVHIYNPHHEKFDKLVSVGVLEHIGFKNYKNFINISHSFIKPDGLFLLHSIGRDTSATYCEPWIDKYIFPNGMLPSLKQIGAALEKKFVVEDFHNFGPYYDKTLMVWYENFNVHWPELKSDYDEKFRRMMNYYLLTCAGGFRARTMQLWQFVLTPNGIVKGYQSIR